MKVNTHTHTLVLTDCGLRKTHIVFLTHTQKRRKWFPLTAQIQSNLGLAPSGLTYVTKVLGVTHAQMNYQTVNGV